MPVTPTMPTPLPKWWRWAVKGAGYAWGVAESLLDYNGNVEVEEELEWRRLAIEWQRATPAGTSEDHAICTFDFVNITGGNIDTSWTPADYAVVENAFGTWLQFWRTIATDEHVAVAAKWYKMGFANPMTSMRRLLPTGPPVKIVALNTPGNLTTAPTPYQIAMSVTERTSIPSHWGRFYIPGIGHEPMTANGRYNSTTVDAVANATHTWYDTCQTGEIFPVVVSTQFRNEAGGTSLQGTLIGVQHIQVDDIPDVVRRRRPKNVAYRKIVPALPAPS